MVEICFPGLLMSSSRVNDKSDVFRSMSCRIMILRLVGRLFVILSALVPGLLIGSILLCSSLLVRAQEASAPPDAVTVFNRAQDLHEKGDLKGAIALYEKALADLPDFPEAEYQRGMAYLALNDTPSAEKAFRRAVEIRPGWSIAINSLSSVLIRRGEVNEATALVEKVLDSEPDNPPALISLTELRLRTGASADVLKELLAKIAKLTSKANPTVSLWNARAALEAALGSNYDASKSLARALSIDPGDALALSLLGEISLAQGDIEKAREISSRLEKVKPLYEPGMVLKARVLFFEGRYDEASATLRKVRSEFPGIADLHSRIGVAQSTTAASLESLLKTNERDPIVLGRLCTMLRRDDPAKALDYCRRASALEPNNVGHAVGFGAALVQARQFESAVNVLSKIIEIAPQNATARANLATALFQLKRYPEAKAEFLWLANDQPDSAGAYYFLGIIHDQMSEYLDAGANYQQYLRLADPVSNKTDIERVNLRLPQIQRLIKEGKGKNSR